jgi:TPR repeat protein
LRYARLACDHQHWDGCNDAGSAYEAGRGVARDDGEARRYYGLACEHGVLLGCNNLGLNYLGRSESPRPEDARRAKPLFERACEGGLGAGCRNLASLYGRGLGVANDGKKTVALSLKGCDLGYGDGCTDLGMYNEAGSQGLPKDLAQARVFYERGCRASSSWGCTNLAVLYANGQGGARDIEQAKVYYRRGCDLGDEVACKNLKRWE